MLDVLLDHVLQRVGRLALREPLARRLLSFFTLFELGIFPLLPLQPFPQRSVARLRQRQRSHFAQFHLPERAITGTVAIEKDLGARSETAHAQAGALGVGALLPRF